jgi:hypothetical protein
VGPIGQATLDSPLALDILLGEMDIDQRLEKLAQRHQALMWTMEVTEHMQQKNEEAHRRNEALLARLMEKDDSSTQIADAQKRRIRGLEDWQQ